MRVGILTQYYPPEIGAPQARLSALARQLVQRGHQVYVLTAMPNYPQGRIYHGYRGLWVTELKEGVLILRTFIYATKSAKMVRRLVSYFSFVISSLVIGVWKFPPVDYLITESPPLFLGFTGYLLSRMKRSRWIFNVSDLWPASAVYLGLVRDGLSLKLAYRLEAFCYRKASLVTCQSKEILSDIQYRFPFVKTYYFPNGVDTSMFCPEKRSNELRRQLSWEGKCVAIYAGLHGIAQGLEQILEAANQLRDKKDLVIILMGDGPQKENLIKIARHLCLQNVHFMDPQPHWKMPVILASADIALVSLKSRLPGAVPSKLYEAMGVGLPVILVAEGEPADIVRRTESGIVVSPGNVKGLALALQDLAENPDKRNLLGTNGRLAAITYFNRQIITDTFIHFLEDHLHVSM